MKTREAVVDVGRKAHNTQRGTAGRTREPDFGRLEEFVDLADVAPASTEPLAPARSAPKRIFELVVSLALALALVPVMALVIVLVRLDSPGPIFFRSRRVGFRGQTLHM
ncbi:MAG: Bacterial sugar transferase, partial [Thermoleophilaceae bacterium]|nr:Bacterial sugar transferase [Thermoleophilaceae bacterium]